MMAAGRNATTCSDVPDPKCEYAKVTLGYQADEAWVVIIAVLIWVSMTYIMYLLAFRELVDDDDDASKKKLVDTDVDSSIKHPGKDGQQRRQTAASGKWHHGDSHGFVL